jgi:hypothetical protein
MAPAANTPGPKFRLGDKQNQWLLVVTETSRSGGRPRLTYENCDWVVPPGVRSTERDPRLTSDKHQKV